MPGVKGRSGRKKGSLNKTTAVLKDAIIAAAAKAGGGSLEAYLEARAKDDNKGPFMSLLGRVVPLQHEGNPDKPIEHKLKIEFVRPNE